ncbi:hypothetical protein BCF53_107109 [Reinekea marinisedimentorum]|uniref:Uncharacterized protein n=1 Tax=Reinekea marinisedimentorum TaxID=230495 RepID=A0A4R3I9V6_9GAMM|nr:hypothetical protein BCF53_107109 [Reinekea marinisedimentorum]
MNFATELFLQAFGLIFSVVIIAEIVVKVLGTVSHEEEN